MDDVILDNICDRVTYFVYSKGQKVLSRQRPNNKHILEFVFSLKKTNMFSSRASEGDPGAFSSRASEEDTMTKSWCNKHIGTRELLWG